MAAQLIAGCVHCVKTFYHSGDLGDIIYSLPAVQALGGGILNLGPDACNIMLPREPLTRDLFNVIAPLLRAQSYITGCEYSEKAGDVDFNLNTFKYLLAEGGDRKPGSNLCRAFLETFKLPVDLDLQPWLSVDYLVRDFPVIISRSARYHGRNFMWQRIVEEYKDVIAFVGLKSEHEAFVNQYGQVPFYETKDLLDLARVIAGCELFIGNQSCPFAIAVGLGTTAILEMSETNPNTLFRRSNLSYGCTMDSVLPTILSKPAPKIKRSTNGVPVCFHSGDYGDIIYALLFLKQSLRRSRLIIGRDDVQGTRLPMSERRYRWIEPLLKQQPYLESVSYSPTVPNSLDYNLNEFRTVWSNWPLRQDQNVHSLFKAYPFHFGFPPLPENIQWLTVPEKQKTSYPVIIQRSLRYQNPHFPWRAVLDKYQGKLAFVGLIDEWRDFSNRFGRWAVYINVLDALDMARLIAGCRLFVGNQSFPMSLAISLGIPAIQETSPETPDCLFKRDNLTPFIPGSDPASICFPEI